MSRFHQLCLLLTGLSVLLCGCGQSREMFVSGHTPHTAAPGSDETATLQLISVLAQAQVPIEVDSFRGTGFDKDLVARFGPTTVDKAEVVEWSEVPVEVTDFVIEYLSAGRVVALAQVAVELKPGETLVVESPPFFGVSGSLESLTVIPNTLRLPVGATGSLTAVGRFSDGTTLDLTSLVKWVVVRSDLARVERGEVEAQAVGITKVTASFGGLSAEADLSVTEAELLAIAISPGSPAVAAGTSQDFTATGFFSDGSTLLLTSQVQWSSSDEEVAVLEGSAASALQPGQTVITARLLGKSGQTVLTVTPARLTNLTLEGADQTLAAGTTTQFHLFAEFSDGTSQNLTSAAAWTTEPSTIASVVQGRVSALVPGQATLRASFGGQTASAEISVTDAVATGLSIQSQLGSAEVFEGQGLLLEAWATYSDGSVQEVTDQAQWSSEPETVATVVAGTVTGVTEGIAEIEARFGGQTATLEVTVNPAPLLTLTLTGDHELNTDTGVLTPQLGSEPLIPGWDSTQRRLEVGSFFLEAGSTLTLTGTSPFQVYAGQDIGISGTVDFSASAAAEGQMGQDGGTIVLFCGGALNLTPTGSLLNFGGQGGAGSNFSTSSSTSYMTNVAGNGVRGGTGGTLLLLATGDLTLAGTLNNSGGAGGPGGSVTINAAVAYSTLTGGQGGPGGASGFAFWSAGGSFDVSGTQILAGGAGGAGGPVTVNGASVDSTLIGGRGGDGGAGTSQGGPGGPGGDAVINGGFNNLTLEGGAGGNGGAPGGLGGAGGSPGGSNGLNG